MTPADQRPPTIVVADDASEVRLLIRTRLRLSGNFDVVGEAGDGEEAVEVVGRLHPDLLLLDVSMPRLDGLEALPRVRDVSPDTRVVMFSGFEEHGLAERALARGAWAFVEKSVPVEELMQRLLHVQAAPDPFPSTAAPVPAYVRRGPLTVDQHVLDEHLERFREVFDQAAIGMATMTLAGNLVRANSALARLVRYAHADLVGTAYADLTDGRLREVAEALERIRTEPVETLRIEHGLAVAGPQPVLLATFAPVRDSLGRPLYVFVQVQDVTVERAAAEELRRSEERFRLLVEAVEEYAIFMLDPGGHVVSWNAGAQRSQGYTAEEIVGRHFSIFYPPDVAASGHCERELEAAVRDGRYEEEGWRVRKDGSLFWANVLITAVHDAEGRHVGFAKVTRDVTERRRAEERLRQSENRFRLLVENVRDYAIFMLDPTGHVVSWNAGAQRIKGYTAEEIVGRHFSTFYPPEVAASGHCERELEAAVRDGRYEEEGWRVRKDGSLFWANVLITAVLDTEGRHLGFAKITRDTSDRRRLEEERGSALAALGTANEELESLNARLRQAADDQAQFLAVTAHELRTPVGVLGSSAELLGAHWSELGDDERSDLLGAMRSSTVRLRRLLEDLLTASRLQASSLTLHLQDVDVADVVADAVTTVTRADTSVAVKVDVPRGLVVRGDRDRLAQAVENLVTNAYTHGVPPVTVEAAAADGRAEVRVRDQGGGVSETVLPRLFERFATGARHGTGLGLYIVRELARAHGGEASYEPADRGLRPAFVMRLPLVRSDPSPDEGASQ